MMENGNINSYGTHTHNHAVTKCLHKTHDAKLKSGGSMSGAFSLETRQEAQKQESFSLKGMLWDGWKNLFFKTSGVFGKVWSNGKAESENGTSGKETTWTVRETKQRLATGSKTNSREPVSAEILAATAVRMQRKRNITEKEVGMEAESKVSNAESAAGSGLWRGQEGARRFLEKFGKTAAKIRRPWNKAEGEKETEVALEGNPIDLVIGDSSYLLDSYNRLGEYSTLAKDRSLEGSFRARG